MPMSDAAISALVESGIFDPEFYSNASGVKGSRADLLQHYISIGRDRHLSLAQTFDPEFYKDAYGDVARSGMPPLLHFIEHGLSEGRSPTAAAERRSAAMERAEVLTSRIGVLERQVALIASQCEQILARVPETKKPKAARRTLPPSVRAALELLSHPRELVSEWKRIAALAKPTSYRARRSGNGWTSRLDRRLIRNAVKRHFLDKIRGTSPTLYKVNQRQPVVKSPRPRILHVIPNVWMGGSTQLILDLFDYLGHEFEMHVMTSSFPPNGRHEGMIIHDLREPTGVEAMKLLMSKFKPNLVHVHYWGDVDLPWYEKAFAAARAAGLPVIQNINTPVLPYRGDPIVATVYVSDYVRREFGAGIPEGREYVVHPGIDLGHFDDIPEMTRDSLDSLGMVYRLEGDKLNMASIDLFIGVVKRRPRTRVLIIGGGTFFQPYIDRTIAEGVRNNFSFTGYVPYNELPSYYAQFGTFVAPVWKESFGQVTPFAMNMGRAVAGYDIGALSEILESGETLAPDIDAAVEKIVVLLDEPERIAALGKRNREIAQRQYGVQKMCRKYGQIYAETLNLASHDMMPGYPQAELFEEK